MKETNGQQRKKTAVKRFKITVRKLRKRHIITQSLIKKDTNLDMKNYRAA